MRPAPVLLPLTVEQEAERARALAAASAEQARHADEPKRLGVGQECQHARGWQSYCGGRLRRATLKEATP